MREVSGEGGGCVTPDGAMRGCEGNVIFGSSVEEVGPPLV